jgi:hypothetical protein
MGDREEYKVYGRVYTIVYDMAPGGWGATLVDDTDTVVHRCHGHGTLDGAVCAAKRAARAHWAGTKREET